MGQGSSPEGSFPKWRERKKTQSVSSRGCRHLATDSMEITLCLLQGTDRGGRQTDGELAISGWGKSCWWQRPRRACDSCVCVCVHVSTGQGAGTHECWDWSDPLPRLQDSGTEGSIECGANMGNFGGRCAAGCVWVSGSGWTAGRGGEGRLGPGLCVEWGLVGAVLGVSVSKAEWGRAGLRHVLQKGSSGPSSCRTCGRVRGGQGRPAHQAQPGPRGLELGALAGSSNFWSERELL